MSLSRHHNAQTWVIGSTSLEIAVMERQDLVSHTYLLLILLLDFVISNFELNTSHFKSYHSLPIVASYNMV